jgi:hypothetical protein
MTDIQFITGTHNIRPATTNVEIKKDQQNHHLASGKMMMVDSEKGPTVQL